MFAMFTRTSSVQDANSERAQAITRIKSCLVASDVAKSHSERRDGGRNYQEFLCFILPLDAPSWQDVPGIISCIRSSFDLSEQL
jgi:hypothetical protein